MTATQEKIERLSRAPSRTLMIAGYADGFRVFLDNEKAIQPSKPP